MGGTKYLLRQLLCRMNHQLISLQDLNHIPLEDNPDPSPNSFREVSGIFAGYETGSIGRGQGVVKGGGGGVVQRGGGGCLMGEGGFLGWPSFPSPLQKNKGGRGVC